MRTIPSASRLIKTSAPWFVSRDFTVEKGTPVAPNGSIKINRGLPPANNEGLSDSNWDRPSTKEALYLWILNRSEPSNGCMVSERCRNLFLSGSMNTQCILPAFQLLPSSEMADLAATNAAIGDPLE